MGRPKGRFTAAKTFTLDIMTLEWLHRECLERKIKASALLTEIIEKHRISLKTQLPDTNTIDVYCSTCNDWAPHDVDMVCKGCNNINLALKAKVEAKRQI